MKDQYLIPLSNPGVHSVIENWVKPKIRTLRIRKSGAKVQYFSYIHKEIRKKKHLSEFWSIWGQ